MRPSRRAVIAMSAMTATLAGCGTSAGGRWQQGRPVTLPGSRAVAMTDRHGTVRELFVGMPEGRPPAGGWPVLYLLDGNATFPTALLLVRNLALRAGFEPAVVVGIGYPAGRAFDEGARARDYTPPAPGLPADGRHGGAEQFLDFIAQDLQPMIAAECAGDPQRQFLFGHSLGGLLVLHALFTRPGLFAAHLAASPSIWWHDRQILSRLPAFIAGRSAVRPAVGPTEPIAVRLLLTVGELEQTPPPEMPAERAALLRQRRQVDSARELAARLAGLPGVVCELRELPGESHGTAMLTALQRAIEFTLAPAR